MILMLNISIYADKDRLAVMDVQDEDNIFSPRTIVKATDYIFSKFQETGLYWMVPMSDRDKALEEAINETLKGSRRECVDEKCQLSLVAQLQANFLINVKIKKLYQGTCNITISKFDVEKRAGVESWVEKFNCTEKGLYDKIEGFNLGQKKSKIKQNKESDFDENAYPEDEEDEFSEDIGSSVSNNGWLTLLTVEGKKGFELEMDGKIIGKTPIIKMEIEPGTHTIGLIDECYESVKKFKIKKGEEKKIDLIIKPKESALKIEISNKSGRVKKADIFVDEKKVGTSSGVYIVPLCSRNLIIESESKYERYSQVLKLAEKNVLKIDAYMSGYKIGKFEISESGIFDTETNLLWQKDGKEMEWNAAVSYCKNSRTNGYNDWRLPTISELRTIISGCEKGSIYCKVNDECLSSGCWSEKCACGHVQNSVFKGGGFQWSSSEVEDSPSNAWYLKLGGAEVYNSNKYNKNVVRCVRNSEE